MAATLVKQAFSERLRASLEKAGIDASKPGLVAREFNRRFLGKGVTGHAAAKWLSGESIPLQDKLVALAAWLGVSPEWLRYGPTERAHDGLLKEAGPAFESDDLVFLRSYRELTPEHRLAVREVALTLL